VVVLGTPAAYARKLQIRALLRATLAVLVAAAAAAVALGAPEAFPTVRLNVAGAVAAAVFAAALAARDRFATAARKAKVGIESEKRVAKVLARIDGLEAVVNGALLGAGGDADHLALGPVCVVVETKTGSGNLSVEGDGRLRVGRRVIPGDPLAQVGRQARALERLCGNSVTAVVCIPDAKGQARQVRGVWVCNLSQLGGVIVAAPRVMAQGRAVDLARELHRRSVAEQAARDARPSR
jgi:hypothetical protein